MNIQQEKLDLSHFCRVIDANRNRAAEGLRVVEDFLRFGLSDAFLSETCKQLRHELMQIMRAFPQNDLLRCRSTLTDVGTNLRTSSEYERSSMLEIAAANLHRVMEAMRVLEEYSKRVSSSAPPAFEALRYRLYTLEKALVTTAQARHGLAESKLYVLADLRYGSDHAFASRIEQLVVAGADVIQLRDKQASDRKLVAAAKRLRQSTSDSRTKMIVNDRPDIALLVGSDGVHVGQDEMTIADVRKVVGPEMLIGVSTHTIEQARSAVLEGADYLGVGPVFSSQTKAFSTLAGLKLVGEVADEISLPAFAIGGIELQNAAEITAMGLHRVAVGASVWRAPDPAEAIRRLKQLLEARANLQIPPPA